VHLHPWDLERFRYPRLDDADSAALRHDCLVADWRADTKGVDVAVTVHLQVELDHALDPVEETSWLASLTTSVGTDRPPVPTVCVGYADLRAPISTTFWTGTRNTPCSTGYGDEQGGDGVAGGEFTMARQPDINRRCRRGGAGRAARGSARRTPRGAVG
jgi:hypothetical protein